MDENCVNRTWKQKEEVYTHRQRGTTVHIFALLPQFCITIFISKLVRLYGLLSFKNKHMSGNLWLLMQKCSNVVISFSSENK